jgi:hypothetical protein
MAWWRREKGLSLFLLLTESGNSLFLDVKKLIIFIEAQIYLLRNKFQEKRERERDRPLKCVMCFKFHWLGKHLKGGKNLSKINIHLFMPKNRQFVAPEHTQLLRPLELNFKHFSKWNFSDGFPKDTKLKKLWYSIYRKNVFFCCWRLNVSVCYLNPFSITMTIEAIKLKVISFCSVNALEFILSQNFTGCLCLVL